MLSYILLLWTQMKHQLAQLFPFTTLSCHVDSSGCSWQANAQPRIYCNLIWSTAGTGWHYVLAPAMDAATHLCSAVWQKNARQRYHIPVGFLDMNVRYDVQGVDGFAKEDQEVAEKSFE
jgi:hypothetical protein